MGRLLSHCRQGQEFLFFFPARLKRPWGPPNPHPMGTKVSFMLTFNLHVILSSVCTQLHLGSPTPWSLRGVASIVTKLWAGKARNVGVQFLARARDFSVLHSVQTGSRVRPASYSVDIVGPFREVKRPGREFDHSTPSSAEIKKEWSYTSTPPYVFMACTGTNLPLRSLLFWNTQRWLVVSWRRFGTTCRFQLQGIGCSETSLTDYESTLRNIPEERRSHLHRSGSLKSRKFTITFIANAFFFFGGMGQFNFWFTSFSPPSPLHHSEVQACLEGRENCDAECFHGWSLVFSMTGCGAKPVALTITGTKPVFSCVSQLFIFYRIQLTRLKHIIVF
jgi:hypothetical protein